MAINQLIIQGTSQCNLNCSYCYIPEKDRRTKQKISLDTTNQIFQKVLQSCLVGQELQILWHSGEPLVAPISFYEACETQLLRHNTKGIHLTKTFQTNGTLLTKKWINFIKKHQYTISISCDGPAFLHNTHRQTWDNKPTHDRVLAGIQQLHDHQIPFSGLCVLTKESLNYPDEIFQFFKDHHFTGIGFNIEETECFNTHSKLLNSTDYPTLLTQYKQFMLRMNQLSEQYPTCRIREIEHTKTKLKQATKNPHYVFQPDVITPLKALTIDTNGEMSTFCPEMLGGVPDLSIGNIHTIDRLEEVFTHPNLIRLRQSIQTGVTNCQSSCDYFRLCGGGRPGNKYFETGTFESTETRACNFHVKALVDSVLDNYATKQAKQTLLPGVCIAHAHALQYKDNHTIMINSGIQPAQNTPHTTYTPNAILPNQDWRPASPAELDNLHLNTPFQSESDIACLDLPPELQQEIAQFKLDQCSSYAEIQQVERSPRFETFIQNTLTPYFKSLSFAFPESTTISTLSYEPAGLTTVSHNPQTQQYNGLHIDDWDRAITPLKQFTRNRICINLGPSPRHFYIVNLTAQHCKKQGLLTEDEHQRINQDHREFLRLYSQNFQHYPVIKLKVNPLQAYIAPTDTIIHDGSSLECDRFDLSIMSLGYFKPST
jgi:uncharacterized protein